MTEGLLRGDGGKRVPQLQQEGKTVALSYAKTQEAFLEEARRLQPACGLYYRDGKLTARWEV